MWLSGYSSCSLMLSLICSALNELIEGAVKNRARDLERGIRTLFADPNATVLVQQLYNHPLVSSLFRGRYDQNKKRNLPAYIPARTFALALMDVLNPQRKMPLAAQRHRLARAGH